MHNTAYLVITYLKRVHNYLDTAKGVFYMFNGQTVLVS